MNDESGYLKGYSQDELREMYDQFTRLLNDCSGDGPDLYHLFNDIERMYDFSVDPSRSVITSTCGQTADFDGSGIDQAIVKIEHGGKVYDVTLSGRSEPHGMNDRSGYLNTYSHDELGELKPMVRQLYLDCTNNGGSIRNVKEDISTQFTLNVREAERSQGEAVITSVCGQTVTVQIPEVDQDIKSISHRGKTFNVTEEGSEDFWEKIKAHFEPFTMQKLRSIVDRPGGGGWNIDATQHGNSTYIRVPGVSMETLGLKTQAELKDA